MDDGSAYCWSWLAAFVHSRLLASLILLVCSWFYYLCSVLYIAFVGVCSSSLFCFLRSCSLVSTLLMLVPLLFGYASFLGSLFLSLVVDYSPTCFASFVLWACSCRSCWLFFYTGCWLELPYIYFGFVGVCSPSLFCFLRACSLCFWLQVILLYWSLV